MSSWVGIKDVYVGHFVKFGVRYCTTIIKHFTFLAHKLDAVRLQANSEEEVKNHFAKFVFHSLAIVP